MPSSSRTAPRTVSKLRRRPQQLPLALHTWGGRRPGAGRPKKPGSGPPHRSRASFASRYPVHVGLRVEAGLPSLRRTPSRRVLEACLREGKERDGFRLVHYSIQHHHLHFIVEASGARSLSSGVKALCIRIARRLNPLLERKGRVFAERYFARVLKTPKEVRACLRYVLLNGQKHESQRGVGHFPQGALDACSSARFFDGFRGRVPQSLDDNDAPVTQARTYLLRKAWRVHGLISRADIPGLCSRSGAP